jgi:hypothetical protein
MLASCSDSGVNIIAGGRTAIRASRAATLPLLTVAICPFASHLDATC